MRVTHICVNKLTIIGSDNGLPPDWRQAIIWTNAGILLIGPLGTNFSEILIEILTFSYKKMRLKVSAKRRPFCLGLNVLIKFLSCPKMPMPVLSDSDIKSHNRSARWISLYSKFCILPRSFHSRELPSVIDVLITPGTFLKYVFKSFAPMPSEIDFLLILAGTHKTQELPCHCGPGPHMFKIYSR